MFGIMAVILFIKAFVKKAYRYIPAAIALLLYAELLSLGTVASLSTYAPVISGVRRILFFVVVGCVLFAAAHRPDGKLSFHTGTVVSLGIFAVLRLVRTVRYQYWISTIGETNVAEVMERLALFCNLADLASGVLVFLMALLIFRSIH